MPNTCIPIAYLPSGLQILTDVPVIVLQMVTDVGFGVSWDAQTKTHFNRSATFNYIFDYRGRNSDSLFPEWMGRFAEESVQYMIHMSIGSISTLVFTMDHTDKCDANICDEYSIALTNYLIIFSNWYMYVSVKFLRKQSNLLT